MYVCMYWTTNDNGDKIDTNGLSQAGDGIINRTAAASNKKKR